MMRKKMSQIRAAYSYMMLHPGCKMMAPDKEAPEELQKFIHDLNELYRFTAGYVSDG